MKIFSFGCSGEERANVGAFVPYAPGKGPGRFVSAGEFVPYASGKGPGKFVSAGDDVGGFTEGVGQGAGIALGLITLGTAYSWYKTRAVK